MQFPRWNFYPEEQYSQFTWIKAEVDMQPLESEFQIVFMAVTGEWYNSDIAVDAIEIVDGPCLRKNATSKVIS